MIVLPRLLTSAGLPVGWTPWILLLDQLVFMVAEVVIGVLAVRARPLAAPAAA